MTEIIESRSDYRHGPGRYETHGYIAPVVLSICGEFAVRRVLDIGCGNGMLCRELADAGCEVVGVEPSASGVAAARQLVPEGVFYERSVYDDPAGIAESGFDLVVSTEVIEHLYKPAALLQLAAAKLKADGLLVLSTPYHGYLKNLALSLANGWDRHHAPLSDGGHIKFWSRQTLTGLLEKHGFRVLQFHGAGRLPGLWKAMILVARKARPTEAP
jgi:2-polyprenyl-3-methyl-5-hydroxy-6-metoxy-1,4-benzoquinol methylase